MVRMLHRRDAEGKILSKTIPNSANSVSLRCILLQKTLTGAHRDSDHALRANRSSPRHSGPCSDSASLVSII